MSYENTEVWGFKHTIRRMHQLEKLPFESDSGICKGGNDGIGCENCSQQHKCQHTYNHTFQIGKKDLEHMQSCILKEREDIYATHILETIHVAVDDDGHTMDIDYSFIRDVYQNMGVSDFKEWAETLPYAEELIMYKGESK